MPGIVSFLALSKDAFPCLVPIEGLEILVEVMVLVLWVLKVGDTMYGHCFFFLYLVQNSTYYSKKVKSISFQVGPNHLKSTPTPAEWVQLPWYICWYLIINSWGKEIYLWEPPHFKYCLKNLRIQFLLARVGYCSQLKIGLFVESTWKIFCRNCDPLGQ